jgi:hypothetical protein
MESSFNKNVIMEYGEIKYNEGFTHGLITGTIVGLLSFTIGFYSKVYQRA